MTTKSTLTKIWQRFSFSGPYAPLVAMFAVSLVVLTLSRFGLVLWKLDRVNATGHLGELLLQGLRVDIIQLCLLSLIPVLLLPIFALCKWWRGWQIFTFLWVVLAVVLLVFLEVATPGFIAEYDVRPNRIFVEYLKYPHEVMSMLWVGFRIHIFASLIFIALTVAALFLLRRRAPDGVRYRTPGYPVTPIVFLLLIALLLFLLGGHNPRQALLGIGVVALGLPVYYLLFRGRRMS